MSGNGRAETKVRTGTHVDTNLSEALEHIHLDIRELNNIIELRLIIAQNSWRSVVIAGQTADLEQSHSKRK